MHETIFTAFPLGENGTAPHPRLARFRDLLADLQLDATAAHEAYTTRKPRGALTGFPSLDLELGGALAPGLHIVHGGPGVGKTAFTFQAGAQSQCPTLLVTTEMRDLELFRRAIARVTSTYLGRLRSGEFPPAEIMRLAQQTALTMPQLVLADATEAYASPDWMKRAAETIRGDARHLLIIVDSIHSWAETAPGDLGSEYDRLNAGLAALRTLSKQLTCAVIGVAERNRTSMSSGGISASAGSRKFEYGGESVWELNADQDATFNAAGEKPITLRIAKNRAGSPGRQLHLLFHGALQRFREADR